MNPLVWPPPRSLATTCGISVDVFSCPYLDVSVQGVPSVHLFVSMHGTQVLPVWVSPFGDLRISGYLLLPEAFRSLSRPSSAPDAKAFPLRSFSLDRVSARCISLAAPQAVRLALSAALPFRVTNTSFVCAAIENRLPLQLALTRLEILVLLNYAGILGFFAKLIVTLIFPDVPQLF